MENTKSCGVSSPYPYWNCAFFLHFFWYTKFSGDLHHLLAKRPANILWPFLMMISQPKHLFSPKVIFLKSGTTLRRHQIKLHSYRAKVQWGYNKEKNLLSLRSNVINIKVNTYFSYMLVISISVYKGQRIWRLSSKYWLNNDTSHQYNF